MMDTLRRLISLLISISALGACYHSSSFKSELSSQDWDNIDSARKEYKICVADNAVELDDGVSDPIAIGKVVAEKCNNQRVDIDKVILHSGMSDNYINGWLSVSEKNAVTEAAKGVLYWRRFQREHPIIHGDNQN